MATPSDERIREVALLHGSSPELVKELLDKLDGLSSEEQTAVLHQVQDKFERAAEEVGRRIVHDWQCPPGNPKTASHLELLAMNAAHALALMGWTRDAMNAPAGLGAAAGKSPKLRSILEQVERHLFAQVDETRSTGLGELLLEWRRQSYARLELGHKLAAALCLTDVPGDIEVHAPWAAWSLVLPDGLLPPDPGSGELVARVWVTGTTPTFGISSDGRVYVYEPDRPDDPIPLLLGNLIRGACLALSSPDEFKKETHIKKALNWFSHDSVTLELEAGRAAKVLAEALK
jgi:hypothetical protein